MNLTTLIGGITTATDVSWIRTTPRPVVESANGLPIGLIVGTALAATVVALLVTLVLRHDRVAHGSAMRRLARGLGLGFADRRLLTRIARQAGLKSAGSLLISQGCFDDAVRRWNADTGRLQAIRRAVFIG